MSVATCLLLYSFVVAVLAPPLLVRLTHHGVAPRLGVTAWMAALGSVVLSWVAAGAVVAAELVLTGTQPGRALLGSCFATLRDVVSGRAGIAVQAGIVVLAVLAILAVSLVVGRLCRRLLRMRSSTHGHARMTRLVGRRVAGVDAVVLDVPERAAYCVAGRPNAIVVTSAALDALDRRQLDAVLAHERAHLTGRHLPLLALLRGLAASLPRMALFTLAETEVARLLEMCADDCAARTHGSRTVLTGLIALSGGAPLPAGAVGATSIAVLDRAQRLAAPSRPTERARTRALLTTATALIATGPLVTGLLAASGVMLCGPMPL
ncbi:M56 family metallopeptidase [Rhodococcus sp. BP-252]|uniref:M56 family metallopeptidase n=1 Tax=unclassified Rhodococcus (in: high G+C Gram-positive bacteria) TaxID=192944 RepID=UPI001C9B7F39|nr:MULTISPECIES: M56 family metallopeptidase [unclassified Rhodococcus (in: high G+C Gram-positive bacteria)]MBY6413313.1 M56 family metallopeptidase [Rhodococcus sp. BP-320]MBY6418083.1 M56 family metallopeptidase [Rhodococcus sp. BP-321]MBY6422227.1 M56 family metallopeptidase [Rhodococcus sp. BP-324]MBY6428132.1 M56 family metallopeptidase [Rhodococcus sp. BP-323]MBY6433234.1 M56 family metallopeptidase [Rhodococcus sp. BP-322]